MFNPVFFFFSSRRRHTRCLSDWSSDVCSSDLSGLLAVPKGQLEAARSLGMNGWYTFLDVTLPQAFKIALPPLVNNIVALLKDSSLASVIGLVELTNTADLLRAKTYLPIPSLVTSASIYLLLTTVMTHFSGAVERRFDIEDKLA